MSADKRQLEQYYAFLAGHIDEVRRMQHDILHHLRVMSGYAQAGDYDRLKEYLDALVEQMPDMDGVYYCGDHAANILLKYYGEQARNGGIRFNCDAQIPPVHRPAHGYQLMQQIARASRGRVQMGPGTLYGVLTRMEKEGLIVLSENDGRRKTYLLTNAGMEALRAEYSRLRAMVRDGAWIGEGGTNEKTQL